MSKDLVSGSSATKPRPWQIMIFRRMMKRGDSLLEAARKARIGHKKATQMAMAISVSNWRKASCPKQPVLISIHTNPFKYTWLWLKHQMN